MTPDVVVIGAGFAGMSAAVRLAAAGVSVLVAEEAPRLGGRATAFADRDSGERVDNGQHVLFGCYRETYAFLEAIGTASLAPLQPRLRVTMAAAGGRCFELSCPPIRPPWHLVAGVLAWRALPFRDRLSAVSLRRFLGDARRHGGEAVAAQVPESATVTEWLRDLGQSPRLCEWLWNPLAIAALNQSPDMAAARPFARVLAELFGPRIEDSSIGVPRVPLDELYAHPAQRFIEARGGRVLTKAPVRVQTEGATVSVLIGADQITPRAIISTVAWHAFGRLFDRVPSRLMDVVTHASAMESSPIVTVNLWFDGPVVSGEGQQFVGLINEPLHWVFDKSAIFGGGTGHVAMVASGAGSIARMENAALTDLAVSALGRTLTSARSRSLLRSVVVREHRASFSLAPGGPARPSPATPLRGLFLAGDWTNTGLPATIESAVQSGHAAAALALAEIQPGRAPRSAHGS